MASLKGSAPKTSHDDPGSEAMQKMRDWVARIAIENSPPTTKLASPELQPMASGGLSMGGSGRSFVAPSADEGAGPVRSSPAWQGHALQPEQRVRSVRSSEVPHMTGWPLLQVPRSAISG